MEPSAIAFSASQTVIAVDVNWLDDYSSAISSPEVCASWQAMDRLA
jgi:hypothetical protein